MFAISLFIPGDVCPTTCDYYEYDKWGDVLPNTVTVVEEGQPFPPTFAIGGMWIEK